MVVSSPKYGNTAIWVGGRHALTDGNIGQASTRNMRPDYFIYHLFKA